MKNTSVLVSRMRENIKFRDIFETQARESDIEASIIVAELFSPLLEEIRMMITKDEYELGINPHVGEDYSMTGDYEVKMNFMWEPATDLAGLKYHEAVFRGRQLEYVNRTLAVFATIIGMPVVLK